MKFTGIYRALVVYPQDVIKDREGRRVDSIKGLRAEFTGSERIFDSEAAQKQNRWSDEDRLEVERYLLTHPEFGHMRTIDGGGDLDRQLGNIRVPVLYLARGQAVPPEHQELVEEQRWWQILNAPVGHAEGAPTLAPEQECQFTEPDPDDPSKVLGCPRKAEVDEMYCMPHLMVAADA